MGLFMMRGLSREGSQVTSGNRLNLALDRSKQPHLVALGRAEQVGAERELRLIELVALAGFLETRAEEVGPGALSAHPAEEIGVVVAAAAKRVDGRHHFRRAIGIVLIQPG